MTIIQTIRPLFQTNRTMMTSLNSQNFNLWQHLSLPSRNPKTLCARPSRARWKGSSSLKAWYQWWHRMLVRLLTVLRFCWRIIRRYWTGSGSGTRTGIWGSWRKRRWATICLRRRLSFNLAKLISNLKRSQFLSKMRDLRRNCRLKYWTSSSPSTKKNSAWRTLCSESSNFTTLHRESRLTTTCSSCPRRTRTCTRTTGQAIKGSLNMAQQIIKAQMMLTQAGIKASRQVLII